jgi:hypothetical protein
MGLCKNCHVAQAIVGGKCLTCRHLCPKCKLRTRAARTRWCVECKSAYMRKWRKGRALTETQKMRDACRSYANVYKQRGKLKVWPCEADGCQDEPQMHHDDYSKPLEVHWLCARHHGYLHHPIPPRPA